MADLAALTAFRRSGDGAVTQPADADALRAALEDSTGLLWVDLLVGSEADVALLRDVFHFPPLTIEDCVSPHVDPAKVDDHGDYLFVVVQALSDFDPDRELMESEVDFYLGPNYVVSRRPERVSAIAQYRESRLPDDG